MRQERGEDAQDDRGTEPRVPALGPELDPVTNFPSSEQSRLGVLAFSIREVAIPK